MATKDGGEKFDASVSSGTSQQVSSEFSIGTAILYNVDVVMLNGATAPDSPMVVELFWKNKNCTDFESRQFLGSSLTNGKIQFSFPMPATAEYWKYAYTNTGSQAVTLSIRFGSLAP